MIVKCINKNTVFYKTLDNQLSAGEIAQITDKIEQESFKNWYGQGERDTFGNPRLVKDIYLINDQGEQITINDLLNDKAYEKRKFYTKDLTYLDKINNFLKDGRVGIEKRISVFRNTDYGERLEKLLEELDKLNKNDYVNALSTHTQYIIKTVESFENAFHSHDALNEIKLTKEQLKERNAKYKKFLIQASDFLQTFSKINALETPKIENLEVTKIIKILKEVENRVSELQNRVTAEVETEVRNTLEGLIKNPEVRRGVMDFLSAQADESKVQMMMDALGDSHVPFLAAVDKFYKLNMAEKDDEVKDTRREWRNFIKAFNPESEKSAKIAFDNFLNRVLEKKYGKRTGRFVQKYQQEYYDTLYDYFNKLSSTENEFGKTSDEYAKIQSEFSNWKIENTNQQYKDEYYKLLNSLSPATRQAKQEFDERRSSILIKGKDNLTLDDWKELKDIEAGLRELKSTIDKDGNKKIGKDLEIANSLYKYNKEMGKFYTTVGVHKKAYDRARREAEEANQLDEWDHYNTGEQFDDKFWEKFKNLLSQYPNSQEVEDIRDEIKQLLLPFKNDLNEIKVDDLPEDIKKQIMILESKKSSLKSKLNEGVDKSIRQKLAREFQNLVKFVPTGEYLKVFKQKQEELDNGTVSKTQYDSWFKANHNVDIYTEEIHPISMWTNMRPQNEKFIQKVPNKLWQITDIKKEYYNPDYKQDINGHDLPKDHWIDNIYSSLSDQDRERLFHIEETLVKLVDHSKDNIIKKGYLPAIPKDRRNIMNSILGKEMATEEKDFVEKAITESDEIVKFIPFKYIKMLNHTKLPEIKEDMNADEKAQVEEQRKKINKQNKNAHGDAIDYDLAETMEHFIDVALTNKYKTYMEADVKLFREQLKQMKIKQTDAKGTRTLDKIKSRVSGDKIDYETSAVGSNTEKHFNKWLEAVFYEDFQLDEGKLTDYAAKIQNFTSLRAMAFNVLSGLNNKIVGNLNERIEAAGGHFYNYKDYRDARKLYFWNITNFIADHYKKESSNLMTAFIKDMDILISEDELNSKPNGLLQTTQHKLKMLKDASYFLQHIGEHQIQNATLIAMSNSHRIIDGEIMTFNEYYEKKKFDVNIDGDIKKAFEAIDNNAQLKNTLIEEFEKYTKVLDAFEFRDGYAILKKDSGITKKDINEFRQRVIGINQRLHGIYNTDDAGMIQRYAIGRLGIQFRKWMRPGWNRRFGAKFGKTIYNERIRDYEEGMYVTTAKYLGSPFTKSWQEYRKAQEGIALAAFKAISKGFKELIFNSKIRWHIMSEMEKANVRRTALEFTFLITVTALGFLAKHMKGDDDDDKLKTKTLAFVLYQADRLFGELSNFTPVGLVREGNRLFKSPSPVFNTFEDVGKLAGALFLYPFRNEEERKFKTGIYHGKDRISVYAQDLIPFWNQVTRLENMNANAQRYGMFR